MPKGEKAITPRKPPVRMLIKVDEYNGLYDRIHNAEAQLARAQSDWTVEHASHDSTITRAKGYHDLAKQTQDQYDGYRKGVDDVLRVIYGKPPVIIERR